MSGASNASAPVSAGSALFAAPPPRTARPAREDSFNAALDRAAESQAAVSRAAARARDNAPKDRTPAPAENAAPAETASAPAGPIDAQWLAQFAAMMGHAHPGFPGTTPGQAGVDSAGTASAMVGGLAGATAGLNGGANVALAGQPGFAAAGSSMAMVGPDGKPVDPSATAADGVLSLAGLDGQAPADAELIDRLASIGSGGPGRRADGVTGSSQGGWGGVADAATGLAKGAAGMLLRGADIVPGFAAVAAAATAAANVANAAASAVSAASAALGGDTATGGTPGVSGASGATGSGASDASGANSSGVSTASTAAADTAGTPLPTHGVGAHTTAATSRADAPGIPGAPALLQGQALQGRLDEALRWMTGNGLQNAELRVTPDALGPITIHVRMDGDTASVMFGSAHEQTRQALEASLGGLRDALAAGGMTLGDASVGSEQQQRQMLADFGNGDRRQNSAEPAPTDATPVAANGAATGIPGDTAVPRAPRRGNGLLNVYA